MIYFVYKALETDIFKIIISQDMFISFNGQSKIDSSGNICSPELTKE